jgi:hypothetical protein
MKRLLTILFLISCLFTQAQIVGGSVGAAGKYTSAGGSERLLFDLGGTGTVANPGAVITSPDGNGRYWNLINGAAVARWWSVGTSVNTSNTMVSDFYIYVDKKPGGTFSGGDSSVNGGGLVSAVSDYGANAVRDNIYFYTGVTTNITFYIPAGKTASIKFWGNRDNAGPRILQIKKSTDGSYTQEYEAAFNTTYATAATFTGLTGTVIFNMRAKTGSTFGHISVIDVTLTY